jgi:hypothetical protein
MSGASAIEQSIDHPLGGVPSAISATSAQGVTTVAQALEDRAHRVIASFQPRRPAACTLLAWHAADPIDDLSVAGGPLLVLGLVLEMNHERLPDPQVAGEPFEGRGSSKLSAQ